MSCNTTNQKITKSGTPEQKFTLAKEYYDKGEYLKALPLFEELIPIYKGSKSIDDIYYMYADCHFQQGDYLIASFHFKNIYDSYSLSEFAEESLYMYAFSYFMLSPEVPLDQTYTEKAIQAFQLYINTYPDSKRMEECNNLIAALWKKLETKTFRSAVLYLKTANYRAAGTTFTNLLKDFPDTQYAEEASFLALKAYYLFAVNSIPSKQLERFEQTARTYKDFSYQYKSSKYLKEAKEIYESSLLKIEAIKNPN